MQYGFLIIYFSYEWYNPIFWTLAIEMQFYILIAFLYPLLKVNNQLVLIIIPLVLGMSTLLVDDIRFVFHFGSIFSQGILLYLILTNKLGKLIGADLHRRQQTLMTYTSTCNFLLSG